MSRQTPPASTLPARPSPLRRERRLAYRAAISLLCACGVLAIAAPTAAAAPISWASPLEIGANALWGVSCPSTGLCVAVDSIGDVVTSTAPAAGAGAWHKAHADNNWLNAVSCVSTALCVAVDAGGNVVTSTDPTGGVGAWTVTHIAEGALEGISCPSRSLCVAIGGTGNIFTSTDPTGGAEAWTVAHVGDSYLSGVSCPSETLCVLVDGGDVVTSNDPTGGAAAWTATYVGAGGSISCPSAELCVMVGGLGSIVTSINPTGGSSAWTEAYVEGLNHLDGVSCAPEGFCVATSYDGNGSAGNVIVSTDPAGGAAAWTESNIYNVPIFPPNPILPLYAIGATGVSCTSGGMCAVVDINGRVMIGTPSPAVAPVSVSPPVVSGTPAVGQTLFCASGSWTGSPAPTFTYQWLRDGAAVTAADAATYIVQPSDLGRGLTCYVTATNSAGSAIAMSNTIQILPLPAPPGSNTPSTSGRTPSNPNGPAHIAEHSRFALVRVRILRSNGALALTLTVPGPGKLQITAKVDIVRDSLRRTITSLLAERTLKTRSAGQITVILMPKARARALLARSGKLTALLTITYKPSSGASGTITRPIAFRRGRH
jgi:hypothetical protein